MLTQENLPCLAPFPSMTHRMDVSLQPELQRPPATPTMIPQTLSDSPKLPRPPPRPKPFVSVLKPTDSIPPVLKPTDSIPSDLTPTDSIPSELTPTPHRIHQQNNNFFDPKQTPLSFGTGPRPLSKNSRDYSKHTEYNLEVRSHKPVQTPDTPMRPSTPSSTPGLPQQPSNAAKIPIQELDSSPYSVKKRFKIGNKKRRYTPTNSPDLNKHSSAEPCLTSFNKSPDDTPNHLIQSFSTTKEVKERRIPSIPLKSFASLPVDDFEHKLASRPSLLKSYSERPEQPTPDIVPIGMHVSPSFDSSDPSVADISSLKLVARMFSQFEQTSESKHDQLVRKNEKQFIPHTDSFLTDFILVDKPYDSLSSSASGLEQLKRSLRKVQSTDNIYLPDDFGSSSSTSAFIDMATCSIPCTPTAVIPKRKAWDKVNSAFSLMKLRGPSHLKRSDPTSTPSISGSEEDDDQGGKILLRSKRPVHEIFRESIRIKKRERLMIASMTKDTVDSTSSVSSVATLESEDTEQKMFEFVIVVGLKKNTKTNTYEPSISYRFPPMNEKGEGTFLSSVPQFCFPDASLWKPAALKPSHNHLSETYSFVLTDELGMKKFGYCRRILPKGKDLPEVYCIISPLGCFSLYSSILDHVETERARPSALVYAFLRSVISSPLPLPGKSVSIKSIFSESKEGVGELTLFRPQESSRLEHVNFSKLICCLGVKLTLQLFAATLLERRIIFVAEQLSLLSSCCHAIVALLYPFSWQHVFVPILPEAMVHICCSPSPFIVGLLPSSLETVLQFGEEMEEAVIFSLDDRKFIRKAGDEENILPSKLQAALISLLTGCDEPNTWREDLEMSDVVIEAFVRFFIEILDIYKDFTYPCIDDPSIIEFQTKPFLKTIKSKASRRFLSEFCKTQMFFNFLQEQGDNPEFSQSIKTLFEERYDEIMSNRVLSSKYGKTGLLKKFRLGKIISYAPGKTK